jgi:group II intron reverse transcriptase/maturase
MVEVLNAIHEEDFLGFSYGFRPGRGPHDALDALAVGIGNTRVNWVLDADIAGFFDAVDHAWLIPFVEHRVGDRRVIRLIRKWLKAGVMEDGEVTRPEVGTPQGSVALPLLANIYLHYVFDLWAARWRRRHAQGNVILVRYADDILAGFEHQADAERFQAELRDRLARFALTLHPDKTRLIQFGRRAAAEREQAGLGKPETFDFLGFTHICGRSQRGRFLLFRRTRRDRKRAKVREVKEELRRRMHDPIPSQGQWLRQVVTGFFAYHAVPTNADALAAFRYHILVLDAHADTAQSEGPHRVRPDQPARGPVAAKATHPSPMAQPTLCRQTSKVGAGCGNAARPVLWGGPVMAIPTAIATPSGCIFGSRLGCVWSRSCWPPAGMIVSHETVRR